MQVLRAEQAVLLPNAGRRSAILRHLGWSRTCSNVHGLRPGSRPRYPVRKAAFLGPVEAPRYEWAGSNASSEESVKIGQWGGKQNAMDLNCVDGSGFGDLRSGGNRRAVQ